MPRKQTTTQDNASATDKPKKALAFPKLIPADAPTSGGYVGAQGNPERGDMLVDVRRYVPHPTIKDSYIGRVENKTSAGTFRAVVFDKPYSMADLRRGSQKQDIKVPPAIRKSRADARFYVEHSWKSRHSASEVKKEA